MPSHDTYEDIINDKITIININETFSNEEDIDSYNNYPKRLIYLNKPTGFNLIIQNKTNKVIRLSFLYIPGFKLLYSNVENSSVIEDNLNNKENTTVTENSYFLSYGNRRTYILDFNNLTLNVFRFYFIPPSYSSRRFLKERLLDEQSIETELKYETSNNINQFPIYTLNSKDLSIIEKNGIYTISVNPIKFTLLKISTFLTDSNYYKLRLYNVEKVNESEITSSNKPKPDYIYSPSKNDSNSIQFEIDKLIYGNYYFEVIATTLDKQIIDYNLLSYNLKKKKKSKWWIALIVIGILLILAGVGFILWKFYFKKKPETNKKDESNNKFNEITPTPNPISNQNRYYNINQKDNDNKSNSTFTKENIDEKEI